MTHPPGVADRFWLDHYPAGVPAEVDTAAYASVVEIFERSVAQYASRDAFVCMDKSLTYAQLDARSRAFAAWLQSVGCKKGTRVALMMPNCLQYPIALFGTLRAGGAVVNVNPMYTPRELEHQLKDSGAEVLVILENFAHTYQQCLGKTAVKHVVVATLGDLLGFPKGAIVNFVVRKIKKMVPAWRVPGHHAFNAVLARGETLAFTKPTLGPNDIAFLQYTGGTTGISKGATLLHRNIVANIIQSQAWFSPAFNKIPANESPTFCVALPLYHIFALTVCCMVGVRLGGKCLLIVNPRDIPKFLAEMRKYRVHMLPAVNTLFNALMNHPDFDTMDWSSLRVAMGGGMAVQGPVAARWLEKTGVPIVEGYGLSETSPVAIANPILNTEYNGTIGLPISNTRVSIRDDDGRPVPLGEPGEICIQGPQVMAGYWNRPDETAKVMTPDGYFKTGDIGFMNARGYTKIVDRKKDMILVSGFNVYPNEVEEVVCACPGVLEVAAVGVPDENSGEAVKVYVVKKDPTLTEQAVREHCAKNLTGYKRPKFIEFRNELPKTNVGKILRRVLRDEASNANP
ncbi:MAG TPA: long-chain-fatty-acid--CoA ligase [Burkholderiaceae bacterium]|nr:long-chain-fatty-acid--CoA ligase [Burkholderiaceae bacterium]